MNDDGKIKSWHRQPGETPTAHARFREYYLSQGEPRSVDAAYRAYYAERHGLDAGSEQVKRKTSPGGWRQWSMGHTWSGKDIPDLLSWRERADAWNAHLARLDEEAWERRRREVREADWGDGDALRDLARRILAEGPNFLRLSRRLIKGEPQVVVQPDGVTMTIRVDREIVTTALDARLAVQAAKAASDLQREAAEVPKTPVRLADAAGAPLFPLVELIQALQDADRALEERRLNQERGNAPPDG